MNLLGPALEVGGTLLDYKLGQDQANSAKNTADMNRAGQLQIADRNIELEKEFAQNGISWRIADAAKNGISPLAALGAPGVSFSPVSIGGDSPTPTYETHFGQMGQDLSRAMMATRPVQEKVGLDLEMQKQLIRKTGSEADYWASMARRVSGPQSTPGLPIQSPNGSKDNPYPDTSYFRDESGRVYAGPSLESMESNRNVPGYGIGRMAKELGQNVYDVWKNRGGEFMYDYGTYAGQRDGLYKGR